MFYYATLPRWEIQIYINTASLSIYHDVIDNKLPIITTVARYSDAAIIDSLEDNHLMIHHDICLTDEEYHYTTKKRYPTKKSAQIMYLFTALWSEVGNKYQYYALWKWLSLIFC